MVQHYTQYLAKRKPYDTMVKKLDIKKASVNILEKLQEHFSTKGRKKYNTTKIIFMNQFSSSRKFVDCTVNDIRSHFNTEWDIKIIDKEI